MMKPAFEIVHVDEAGDAEAVDDALAEIFFETAVRQTFATTAEREAYRHRWYDRYTYRCRATIFAALDDQAKPIGYVLACPFDVRKVPSFSDIGHFEVFSDLIDRYPAHLHVNVTTAWQSRGVGRALVERGIAACRTAGALGIHVVTAADAPNIGFYDRCGLVEVARRAYDGRLLVMLATT